MPSLRIDENEIPQLNTQKPANRSRSPRFGGPPMSQISGVSRPLLSHTNSFTGERMPTFGVDTPHENALGTLLGDIDTWGIDIFKISELSLCRPLTSVAYTVFQVSQRKRERKKVKIPRKKNHQLILIDECVCGWCLKMNKHNLITI